MDRILVADDDRNIARLISDSLADEGFEITVVHDGSAAVEAVRGGSFSLILLDIMMPGMDGIEVMRRIRDHTVCPILFVTAKSRTLDTLVGLELGADDYITKPFVVEELVAKVKAHIRRDKRKAGGEVESICFGDYQIRRGSFEVLKNGEPVELTTREFQLLMYLYDHMGQVLTREQIFDSVWGMNYFDVGSVTVTIKNLRDKMDPENRHIKTVWGVGYKFVQ